MKPPQELNDHLLLRINKAEGRAIGLSIFDYSLITQPTEFGLRGLPLTGLSDLSDSTRKLVLSILQSEPVHSILTLFAYAPTETEIIPVAVLHSSLPLRKPDHGKKFFVLSPQKS